MRGYFIIDETVPDFDLGNLIDLPKHVSIGTPEIPLVTLCQDSWKMLRDLITKDKHLDQAKCMKCGVVWRYDGERPRLCPSCNSRAVASFRGDYIDFCEWVKTTKPTQVISVSEG